MVRFVSMTTESKIVMVVLSTVVCWNWLENVWLAKVCSIFWFSFVGYDVGTILISHIWARSICGGCRWVEIGRELLLLFDENWHVIGVLLSYVWCMEMSATTFLFIILLSKLVLCCAVFCGNGEGGIGGRYSVFL